MVMGAVEGARRAVRRLQQNTPPDGPADLNRPGRVDGARELTPGEQPDLQPHAPFSAFLAFERIGVDEIQVAQHYSGPLEPEGIEHGRASSDRRDAGRAAARPGSRRQTGAYSQCAPSRHIHDARTHNSPPPTTARQRPCPPSGAGLAYCGTDPDPIPVSGGIP